MARRLDHLLRDAAARTPAAPAVCEVSGGAATYAQLDGAAQGLAALLTALGIGAGDRVAVWGRKRAAVIAAVMGVLRAGAAYVPLDPTGPLARAELILQDCAVAAVIADAPLAERRGGTRATDLATSDALLDGLVLVDERVAGGPAARPARSPEDLAYVLYTSGSTGRPKGVMHTHASALAFIDWCSQALSPSAHDRFSSHAPLHFDLSILDLFVALAHGASVTPIDDAVGKQPAALVDLLEQRRLSVWYSTPSVLRLMCEHGGLAARRVPDLRLVLFAGEVFPPRHLRALTAALPGRRFFNLYGPTETNVCTFHEVGLPVPPQRTAPYPIGQPCSGDRVRVADDAGAEVAAGEQGELLVTGGSVMCGYWNLPDASRAAFLTDESGVRWYRTGDVVHRDAGGDLVYAGRRDRMVKRRGFRVELGEIEAVLHRHPTVVDAAVVAVSDDDGMVVTAVVVEAAGDRSQIAIKAHCARLLPLYMIPDRIVFAGELPRTSTAKTDYQRLLELIA